MKANNSWRPYFIATQPRPLSDREYTLVDQLLGINGEQFRNQLPGLVVVGRCGCGICPTIYFQPYTSGNNELEVSQLRGLDFNDELVCATLIQDDGVLTQLEVYSVDGHQPFGMPNLDELQPAH